MPEQELNPAASKFISSLVKSLQIICNGHVDFNESIELVGHINLRVDNKFKFDYIVDEQVSKIGEDCSTTFRSNSYHSSPPPRDTFVKDGLQIEADLSLASLQTTSSCFKTHGSQPSGLGKSVTDMRSNEDVECNYDVNVESLKEHDSDKDKIVFKLEGGDDSNECIILSSTSGDLEPPYDMNDAEAIASGSTKDSHGELRTRKRQKTSHGPEEVPETKVAKKKRTMPRRTKTSFPTPTTVQTKPRKFANPEEVHRIDQLWSKRDDNYSCNSCSYNTTYRNRVRAHCRSVHMGIPRKYKGNEKGLFVCDKCGKEFTSNRGFRMHILSKHMNQYPYHCQECSKGFMSVSTHRDHMNMHAGVALQCMGCETLFYTEYGLKRHLLRKHPELLLNTGVG